MSSGAPNYSLDGHERGVNCIDYFQGGDKPYLVSGGDDKTVKVWDYLNKSCVQTLSEHTNNVSVVSFHPTLPIIITGSEDTTVRIWNSNTYRLEKTLNYGMDRVWAISTLKGSNSVAVGYDEGSLFHFHISLLFPFSVSISHVTEQERFTCSFFSLVFMCTF